MSRYRDFFGGGLCAVCAALACIGSMAMPASAGETVAPGALPSAILVEEVSVSNPDQGPQTTAREITERICRDLLAETALPVGFAYRPADAARLANGYRLYRLGGSVSWVTGEGGGARLALDLHFSHEDEQILIIREPSVSLPEASRAVSRAIASPFAQLTVTTNRPGAQVWLDGTPAGVSPLTLEAVPFGSHALKAVYGRFQAEESVPVDNPVVDVSLDLPGMIAHPVRITNPADGPAVTGADLTERLCRDLASQGTLPLMFLGPDAPLPKNTRYVLQGTATWVRKPGQAGTAIDISLSLSSFTSGKIVLTLTEESVSLDEAAAAIASAFRDPAGSWTIVAAPNGSDVYFDQKWAGVTPFDTTGLFFDEYKIRVSHKTKIDQDQVITFNRPGQVTRVALEDRPIVINLNTNPPGSRVFLDGEYRADSPCRIVIRSDKRPLITLKGEGRYMHVRSLKVEPYSTYQATVDMASGSTSGDPIFRVQDKPFLYRDFHLGIGVDYAVHEQEIVREVLPQKTTVVGVLGFCAGLVRINGTGFYGLLNEKGGYGVSPGLLDEQFAQDGLSIQDIDVLSTYGVRVDVALTLPFGRSAKGRGMYPYAGAGFEWDWYKLTTKEALNFKAEDTHPYALVGLTIGALTLEARRDIRPEDPRWLEFGMSLNWVYAY